MTLRAATAADAEAVAGVHLRSRAQAMPWLPALHTDDESRTWVREVLLPTRRVHVGERGGRVVAYSAVRDGWLEHLYVDPEAQGAGLGGQLLERAKADSGGQLRLHVFERNTAARGFYAAAGFREVARGAGGEEGLPDLTLLWSQPDPHR